MTASSLDTSLDARFAQSMGALLGPEFPSDIALAVSGGGDSMAMLTLAHNWARVWGLRLWVVTVDHGLRRESADEAAMVADECALLGHEHATLRWHWNGQGNLQDAARRGRLEVIDRWRCGLEHVLFAHTKDDLAETFLMRLKRGSGVEGLSAMQASLSVRPHPNGMDRLPARDVCWSAPPPEPTRVVAGMRASRAGFQVIRPCLDMRRDALRHYLRTLKGRWVEDPSNDNPDFDRVRMRRLLSVLEDEGLGTEVLAATASRLSRAREALRHRALAAWNEIGAEGQLASGLRLGDIRFARDGFETLERDTQLRLLAAALQYVSTAHYRPRAQPLEALLDRLLGGGGATLSGCEVRMERDFLWVFREFNAVRAQRVPLASSRRWDARWTLRCQRLSAVAGVEIGALGETGWQQAGVKPKGSAPHALARALPALWQGDQLLACPAIGYGPETRTNLCPFGQELYGFSKFLSGTLNL